MKKHIGFLAAILLVTVLLVSESNAQPFGKGKMGNTASKGTKFVDANSDGVCDNYTGTAIRNQGTTKPNFVDANGDGICDLNTTGTGTGTGAGKKNKGTSRPNFIDADGDGICDLNQ